MKNFMEAASRKLNHLMWALLINGAILVALAILIVAYPLVLEVVIAVAVLIVAYSFFYGAYKLYGLKKLLK